LCIVLIHNHFGEAALAQKMWDGREIMQAALISPEEAVAQAKARLGEVSEKNVVGKGKGTIIFSDAADATTSGASGNSNQLLRCLVDGGYTGSVLFPIVDPDAVAAAKALGEGSSGKHTLRVYGSIADVILLM
jgi:microcystin degradation protein MlrC